MAIASFLIQCASRRAAGALPIYRVLKVRQKKATSDGVISSFLLLFFSCLSPSPSPLFFFFFSSSLFLFSLSVLPLFFFSSFLFLVFFSLSFPSFSSEELLHGGSTFRVARRGRARKPPHACSLLSPPPRTLVSVERAQFPQHRVHGGERVEATAAGCKPRQHLPALAHDQRNGVVVCRVDDARRSARHRSTVTTGCHGCSTHTSPQCEMGCVRVSRSLAYIETRLRELETQTIYGPDLESSETRLKIWSVLGATAEG